MATLVAGLRGRRLRPARLCEPQLHCLIRRPILSGSGCGVRPGHRRCPAAGPAVLRTAKAQPKARPSAAGKPITVFPPEERARPKARPSSPPRVCLTAAPLSLRRCRSAPARWACLLLTVARWDFISILLTAKRAKSLFRRAGDGFFVCRSSFFAHSSLSARLGKSCQNTQASFDDFPL